MAYNILIVDDSRVTRAIIAKTLGYAEVPINELYQAENGAEALKILNKNWIDLVLADINMPVMNGIEMIDKMSEDSLLKIIPVVVISTEGSQARIDELKSKGVREFVRKPFRPGIIKDIVNSIL